MEAPMEDSAAILHQISSLKDMLDQVNEEIKQNIEKSRKIESEIVRHSQMENECLVRECELHRSVQVSEFELVGWMQVSGTKSASVEVMEIKLKSEKSKLEEIKRRFSDKMDKFTEECTQFQAAVMEDSREMASLVEEKEALEKEMLYLEQKMSTFQNSTTDYIQEILEDLHRSCSVLEADLRHGIANYKSVLEDIHNLKIIFANTIGHEDASH